jgi:small subunit ribosomal protein S17
MEKQSQKQNKKRVLTGIVVSNKMAKTIVFEVKRILTHPLYRKRVQMSKRFKADTGSKTYQIGDRVRVVECRPLSHDKRWRVVGKA